MFVFVLLLMLLLLLCKGKCAHFYSRHFYSSVSFHMECYLYLLLPDVGSSGGRNSDSSSSSNYNNRISVSVIVI